MKILNLYAGLGGNRKLWGDEHEITSVENNVSIANCYEELYPNDEIVIGDSIEYLKKNIDNFDFIWASPPCYTHTRFTGRNHGLKFPNLEIYSFILVLRKFFKGNYCIENVIPWYPPLIKETVQLGRHYFWSNFTIPNKEFKLYNANLLMNPKELSKLRDVPLGIFNKLKGPWRNHDMKGQVLRNMVNPEIGKYIMNCSMGIHEKNLVDWMKKD